MVPAVPDLAIKVVADGIPLEKQNEDRRDFEQEISMKPTLSSINLKKM